MTKLQHLWCTLFVYVQAYSLSQFPTIMQPYRIGPIYGRTCRHLYVVLHTIYTVNVLHQTSAAFTLHRPESTDDRLTLHVVRTQLLELREVRLVDAAGDVLACEDGAIEGLDAGVEAADGGYEVWQCLEDDEVGADRSGDFFGRAPVCDELGT